MKYTYTDCLKLAKELGFNNERYCYFLFCHIANDSTYICDTQISEYKDKINRLISHEPLDSVIGYTVFMGLKFPFSVDYLTPRQETEIMTDKLVKYINQFACPMKVLDLCTGSGCIGISIAKYTSAQVTIADISAKALSLAKINAQNMLVNVECVQSDMFANIHDTFDIIVCNPPYITMSEYDTLEPEVKNYDPKISLTDNADGLQFYRILASDSPKFLRDGGAVVCEIGALQGESVKKLFAKHYKYITILQDYSGHDRIVVAHNKENLCLPN